MKACIIGLGRIGALYDPSGPLPKRPQSHASAYSCSRRVELVGGADTDVGQCELFASTWGVPAFQDYLAMLNQVKPDIVSVCMPPEGHQQACLAALDAGVRAIICEKPFTTSLASAHQLSATCAERGVLLAVNHWMRWCPQWNAVRDIVRSGGLGELQQVRYIYAKGVRNSGSHAVDMLHYLWGAVGAVRSETATLLDTGELNIDARVLLRSGLIVDLRTVDYRHHFTTELDLIGTAGRLVCDRDIRHWKVENNGLYPSPPVQPPCQALPVEFAASPMATMVDEVAAYLLNGSGIIRCSGYDGANAMRVVEALEQSWHTGQKTIVIDEEEI